MPQTPTSSVASASEPFRLPRTIEPEIYHIELEPDIATATFSGTVRIDAIVHETADEIVLNAAELAISDVEVLTADGLTVLCSVRFNDELEQVTFQPAELLPPGSCTISCRFSGTLNDKLRGFYRSTYTGPDGETHTMATTQFESVDARRSFPCFDEPDRKAVFEVTLVVEPDLDAISNSPVVSVDQIGHKQRIRFAPTMKMSTYLVAFVVGKLEMTETVDVDGVPLRVVCTPGKLPLAEFALEVGAFALRFFTEYFNIPYPGDKVDLVAIPDFAAGAMENLGCITFRDTALLVDKDEAAPRRARAGRRRHRARAGPHVVRRPRHHGMVGGHLAERGLRHLHGDALRRRLPSVMGPLDRLRALPRGCARRRCAAPDPPDRIPGRAAQGGGGHVRRADLREGLRRAPHARAAHRPRGLPRRRADVPQGPRLRQHRDH